MAPSEINRETESPDQIGYCTNVHAGADLAATQANLAEHALAVKERFSPSRPMGVGLWLSAQAAAGLGRGSELAAFAEWLREAGLVPFTFNGFPYGDFHQPVVKHRVYQPTWFEPDRVAYTLNLVEILHALLPEGMPGSISTLPLAWSVPPPSAEQLAQAAANLRTVAGHLANLEQQRGRRVILCIEPEPGCAIQRSDDVVRFFEEHLLPGGNEQTLRRYLGVCHDVCHAAVMFEPQADVLGRYAGAGITVGKVQISSAVRVDFDRLSATGRPAAVAQLEGFAEDRYLHQTCIAQPGGPPQFWEDLPQALAELDDAAAASGQWRVHFHVPVYLERFELLETSQRDILECLEAARSAAVVRHFEVETYAWSVLPEPLRQATLAEGIARELSWFSEQLTQPAHP